MYVFPLSGLFHLPGCLEISRDQRGPDNQGSTASIINVCLQVAL